MLPKKGKRNRRVKKALLLFFVFCILFLIIAVILVYSIFFAKKTLYISPVTKDSSHDAKKIETLLLDAQIAFVSISIHEDSSYKVLLKDGGQVVLSLKKDIGRQITSLQPILKQFTIDGRKFNRIDFRFDKPLVVYE